MIRKKILAHKNAVWAALIVLSLAAGYWGEMLYMRPGKPEDLKQSIETKIQQQRGLMLKELGVLQQEHALLSDSIDFIFAKRWRNRANEQQYFWILKGDSMVFWNSNKIILPPLQRMGAADRLVMWPNSTGFVNELNADNGYRYIGFVPLKVQYPIENRYVTSSYNSNLEIPLFTPFSTVPKAGWSIIKDAHGIMLFSLHLDEASGKLAALKYVGAFGYAFALLFMFLFWSNYIGHTHSASRKNSLILLSIPFMFLLVWGIGSLNAPAIFYEFKLFSPEVFGMPGLFGNLGMILIFSLLWLGIGFLFNRNFVFKRRKKWLVVIPLLILVLLTFHELVRLYHNLVVNSVIAFEINRLGDVDVYSFVAHLVLIALFGGWFLFVDRIVSHINKLQILRKAGVVAIAFWVLVIVIYVFSDAAQMVLPLIAGATLMLFAFYMHAKRNALYTFFSFFLMALLVAALGLSLTWSYRQGINDAKEATLLINRSSGIHNEHDPFAEMGLIEINGKLTSDSQLISLMAQSEPDVLEIEDYIRRVYFNRQWNNYDVQVIVCWPESELSVENSDEENSCYEFFQQMIGETGEALDNKGLFYLNNKNGRISYFIWDKFQENQVDEVSLFIDIESRLTSIGSGYPELVRDLDSEDNYLLTDYSFARYVDGVLISYSGDYAYNLSSGWLGQPTDELTSMAFDNHHHLIYKESANELFVLSKPDLKLMDLLLYLLYLFLFLFVLIVSFIAIFKLQPEHYSLHSSTLESRIRAAILFIILLSFVLVGFASVHYNIKQYRNKQVDTLKEKTRSVMVMLDQITGESFDLTDIGDVDLTGYLRSISNSLYVDINLYNNGGMLIASSRPELFERRLQSREMNPNAFDELNNKLMPWSLQNEYLGSKEYLSAYKSLYNWNNQKLGYVNLPHFVSSDEASKDLSDFIVVVLNIYLAFVLLAILLTVVLARQITRPLQTIREKLSEFRLRERNEKIQYSGKDEIASLVKEYNRLVDELQSGAEQLATTERTSAWRQMARQIAHEIKNPLTPMKLSIQHLQRAKKDQHEKFDEFFEKTSVTLIEQIDNLSKIATEFSSFSKVAVSNPEKINIYDPVHSVVDLFKETANLTIELNEPETPLFVWADKEQLIQVFNNLVKNASQAMPRDRNGLICISFELKNEDVLVTIADNGTGIAKDAKEKLFEPNFTTKRTGMGVGLAISRNIINSFKGEVWFEDNQPTGTVFYVKLPKYIFS